MLYTVGSPLAGQRVRIRLDGILLQVIDDAGHLRRTMRCPVTPAACARLRGARPAGPSAGPEGPRRPRQARKVVHVHIEETALTVYDGQAAIVVVPRQSSTDVNRFRAKHQIRTDRAALVATQ